MLADTSMKMGFGMPFLPLSNADIGFVERLVWRSYTMQRPCFSAATKRVGFVDKREYAIATLDGP